MVKFNASFYCSALLVGSSFLRFGESISCSNTRRLLDETTGWLADWLETGSHSFNAEEVAEVASRCGTEEYEMGLFYVEAPHFVFGAWPKTSTKEGSNNGNDCPTLGFDSVAGQKVVWRADDAFQYVSDKFVFEAPSFELNDILQVVADSTPISESEVDWEFKSCVHYAQSLWLALGIEETVSLGDFLVDHIVSDERFPELVRSKRGGIFFIAMGDDKVKEYVHQLVFSPLEVEETASSSNLRNGSQGRVPDSPIQQDAVSHQRRLDACDYIIYDMYLVIEERSFLFASPQNIQTDFTCEGFVIEPQFNNTSQKMQKFLYDWDLRLVKQELAEMNGHPCLLHLGDFSWFVIEDAYKTVPLAEEYDLIDNNAGTFLVDIGLELGYHSNNAFAEKITECLLSVDHALMAELREWNAETGTCASHISDALLMRWFVKDTLMAISGDTGSNPC